MKTDRLVLALEAERAKSAALLAALEDIVNLYGHSYPLDDIAWKRAIRDAQTAIRHAKGESA